MTLSSGAYVGSQARVSQCSRASSVAKDLAGKDRTVVFDQYHRLGQPSGFGPQDAVELLQCAMKSLLHLAGLIAARTLYISPVGRYPQTLHNAARTSPQDVERLTQCVFCKGPAVGRSHTLGATECNFAGRSVKRGPLHTTHGRRLPQRLPCFPGG